MSKNELVIVGNGGATQYFIENIDKPKPCRYRENHRIRELLMYIVKLDLKHGLVLVDSAPIATDEKGVLAGSIEKLCLPPIQTDEKRTQYHLLRKASVFEKSADGVIEVGEGRVCAVTFLFDLIEFFESGILESTVLKACETLNLNFTSNHPSTAFLNSFEWGQVTFFYDSKQGDLSLDITFQRSSNEPSLEACRVKT